MDENGIMITSELSEALSHDYDRDDLMDIIRERSFRTGDFVLASGQTSHLYFNLKPTLLDVHGAKRCGDLMAKMVKEIAYDRADEDSEDDRIWISGLAVGAVPLIATMAASDHARIQGTFVRNIPKDHGTRERIEGLAPDETLDGHNVIIVEDVCTTGKSIMEAVDVIRAAGAIVTDAVTVIERGGRELLHCAGVELHSLFREDEFLLGR